MNILAALEYRHEATVSVAMRQNAAAGATPDRDALLISAGGSAAVAWRNWRKIGDLGGCRCHRGLQAGSCFSGSLNAVPLHRLYSVVGS
jgi:hypothetical protein